MKQLAFALFLLLFLLSGCIPARELDAYGYAVMLGLDVDEKNEITVSFLFQNIGRENVESGGDTRVVGVPCKNLFDAVEQAEAALPFSVNLSRLSCIVASRRAAESGALRDMLLNAPHALAVREYVNILVAENGAAYLEAVEDELVPSVTKFQSSQLDYSENTGMAANVTLAMYRETISSRIDCAAPLCRQAETEGGLDYAIQGSALFADGLLAGQITPEQTQLLQMAAGDFTRGRREFAGKVPFALELRADGRPQTQVYLGEAPAAYITIPLIAASDEPLPPNAAAIAKGQMEQQLRQLFLYCRAANSDVFLLSMAAAEGFTRAAYWEAYDWDMGYGRMTAAFTVELRMHDVREGAEP